MPELGQRLRALRGDLDWPETPDIAVALPALPERRRRPVRPLVVALAAALVALVAALSVPQARSAVLHFFHLGGVTVERVDRLPAARPIGPLRLGVPVTLEPAGRLLGRPVLLPQGDRPDGVYFDGRLGPRAINVLYGTPAHPRLLVEEFLTGGFGVVKKYLTVGAPIEYVSVGGRDGLWVPAKHVAQIGPLPPRLATSTLIWVRGSLTIRLEGDMTKDEALDIARSFG